MNLDTVKKRHGKRRFKEVTLFDGDKLRLRSLLRSEQRKWHKSTKKEDGTPDPQKTPYSDDILLAMTIVDEDGNQLISVEEALQGCFDDWDTADTGLLIEETVKLSFPDKPPSVEASLKNSDGAPGTTSSGGSADAA